jgi:hypothetical protein
MQTESFLEDPGLATEGRRVRLGRSQIIAATTAVLFDLVLRTTAPQIARATHTGTSACGPGQCHCCLGVPSCGNQYENLTTACPPLGSGAQCWYTCDCTSMWLCCDYKHWLSTDHSDPNNWEGCVCQSFIQPCGPPC